MNLAADVEILKNAQWLSPPPSGSLDDKGLVFSTAERTDFWQVTEFGYRRDDGHFLHVPATGDFTAVTSFEASYDTLYDQAGLMLRQDEGTWLKAGIEYADDRTNRSVVVTRTRSDWSVVPSPGLTGPQHFALTRKGGAVMVFAWAGSGWELLRLADYPEGGTQMIGVMACSPEGGGFRPRFTRFTLGPATDTPPAID